MSPPTHAANQTPIRLGIVPLCDCAPIAVAKETGIFERHGLNVKVSKELGWASVRDKIYYGELDAAQSITGIALDLGLGLGRLQCDVAVPLVLSLHGNAITLAKELDPSSIGNGEGLKTHLAHYWKKNRPLTLAAPHRYSSHHILLHSWLQRHGIDPGPELQIIFLPPPLMPDQLASGQIDGYCVGEPWNSTSILDGTGWSPATSSDLAYGHPEKVLLISGRFTHEHPQRTLNLVAALLEACELCQKAGFLENLISILSLRSYTGVDPEILRNSFSGSFQTGRGTTCNNPLHLFHGDAVNRPTAEKFSWQVAGMRATNDIPDINKDALRNIQRDDIYTAACSMNSVG